MFGPLRLSISPGLAALRQEARASEAYIPYAAPVDDWTIRTLEGHLLQTIRVAGFSFDTEERGAINLMKHARNHLWKTFNTSELAVYSHLVRRVKRVLPEGEFAPGFAHDLNERWIARLRQQRQYTNELYLTLIHKPGEGAVRRLEHVFTAFSHKLSAAQRQKFERQARERLNEAMRTVMEAFKAYGPEPLGMIRNDDGAVFSESMAFLGFLINLEARNYLRPHRPIAQLLASTRPTFGHDTITLERAADRVYAGLLSIKEYDDATAPPLLDRLLALPQECVLAQSFRLEERAQTEGAIKRQRGRLIGTRDSAVTQIAALDEAQEELKGEAGGGVHHATLLTWAASPETLTQNLSAAAGIFAERGITAVRETVNLPAAFYAQLPGNFKFIARGAPISTKNFASFASYHNYAHGRQHSKWGPALTVVQTASGTPYYLNLHVQDRGNTLVLGPTGQGKTLTVAFLLAQSLKLGGRRVVLDKDRGLELFVRAVGGKYFRIEAGRPTGWNPLQLPDSPAVRGFLADWLEALVSDDGGEPVNSDDRQKIKQVVAGNFDLAPEHRVLRHLAPMFGHAERDKLAKRLLAWYDHPVLGPGSLAWLFDHPRNELRLDADVVGFDLTYLLDHRLARPAALLWLFFVIEALIDGRPTVIFGDEGWKLLDDELVARRVENFEFTNRKNNVALIFATQAPETVMASKIAPALKGQSETLILLPNREASAAVYCDYLGLNRREFEWIRTELPRRGEYGWFLVKNSEGCAVCRLDLTGMEDDVAVLSGNRNTVALLDELLARHGEAIDAWLPEFHERWRGYAVG